MKEHRSLLNISAEIAAEWHPSKNGDLQPSQVTAYSELCKEKQFTLRAAAR